MKGCRCEEPVENINPRHRGHCVKCSKIIAEPEWESNDRNLGLFFERLAESMFPAYCTTRDKQHLPQWFFNFYRECSGRERAGRKKFGYAYLRKNGPLEAQEEAADLLNYLYMETLRRRRLEEEEEVDVALIGAMHAAKAYETAQRMKAHSFRWFSDGEED